MFNNVIFMPHVLTITLSTRVGLKQAGHVISYKIYLITNSRLTQRQYKLVRMLQKASKLRLRHNIILPQIYKILSRTFKPTSTTEHKDQRTKNSN